jgi:predicted short-subunit dehydrogenase-like oxidoreductase (DUF2520 family)
MIAIVGGGRMGRGLALALTEAGERVELTSGRPTGAGEANEFAGAAATIILAVPDDAIATVARRLAAGGTVTAGQAVLHLSGFHDRAVLAPLAPTGAALGSLHPLQTVAAAESAGQRWRGAYAALEGDLRAVAEGERLARLLGLHAILLPAGAKPGYHAGAVIASNYLVALAVFAARVAERAGISPGMAARIYLPLMRGALENLEHLPPSVALTGPVRRGDLETVQAHLAILAPEDRVAYGVLGLEALRLAEAAGLEAERAAALGALLRSAVAGA